MAYSNRTNAPLPCKLKKIDQGNQSRWPPKLWQWPSVLINTKNTSNVWLSQQIILAPVPALFVHLCHYKKFRRSFNQQAQCWKRAFAAICCPKTELSIKIYRHVDEIRSNKSTDSRAKLSAIKSLTLLADEEIPFHGSNWLGGNPGPNLPDQLSCTGGT